jgi:hypothetical protein
VSRNRVVGGVLVVLVKGNGRFHFLGPAEDLHVDAEVPECGHGLHVEHRHRFGFEWDRAPFALGRLCGQSVVTQVELDLESA